MPLQRLFILLIVLTICPLAKAQIIDVDLFEFPQNEELFPRNIETNDATFRISGIMMSEEVDAIVVQVFRGFELFKSLENPVGTSGTFNFIFDVTIPADAMEYNVSLGAKTPSGISEIESAFGVVAGDVYLVNGQSNAEAGVIMHPDDEDPLLRGIDADGNWGNLKWASPGLWGGRVAKRILEEQNIPVAIINSSEGATYLSYFLEDYPDQSPNNFERVRQKLATHNLLGKVRGSLWFQGETDGWMATIDSYKTDLLKLIDSWKNVYGVEQTFFFQIRYQSCTHPFPYVLEAQRLAALESPDAQIMSTSNANHDGCHYTYEGGYQSIADRLFKIIENFFYDGANPNAPAPDIEQIKRLGPNQLELSFRDLEGGLSFIGQPWYDFSIEGSDIDVVGGYVSEEKLILTLNQDLPPGDYGLSYLCHPGSDEDYVVNSDGVGILSFYDQPIELDVATLDDDSQAQVRLFPNPTRGFYSIEFFNEFNSILTLEIWDANGRKVEHFELSGPVCSGNLTKGIYFLRVLKGGKMVFSKRLLVR